MFTPKDSHLIKRSRLESPDRNHSKLRGGFNYFLIFTPNLGEDESILTCASFSTGLVKNHQLEAFYVLGGTTFFSKKKTSNKKLPRKKMRGSFLEANLIEFVNGGDQVGPFARLTGPTL